MGRAQSAEAKLKLGATGANKWAEAGQIITGVSSALGLVKAGLDAVKQAGDKVIGVLDEFSSVGSRTEQWEGQFAHFTGSVEQAQLKMDNLKSSLAGAYGVEEILDAAAAIETLGINSETFLVATANIAGSLGRELSEVSMAMAQAFQGKWMAIEKLGISMEEVIDKLGGDKSMLSELDLVAEALEDIASDRFAGGIEGYSKTFESQVKQMQNAWFLFKEEIADAEVFETIKAIIDSVLASFRDLNEGGEAETAAKIIGETISDLLLEAVLLMATVASELSTIVSTVKAVAGVGMGGPRLLLLEQMQKGMGIPGSGINQATAEILRGIFDIPRRGDIQADIDAARDDRFDIFFKTFERRIRERQQDVTFGRRERFVMGGGPFDFFTPPGGRPTPRPSPGQAFMGLGAEEGFPGLAFGDTGEALLRRGGARFVPSEAELDDDLLRLTEHGESITQIQAGVFDDMGASVIASRDAWGGLFSFIEGRSTSWAKLQKTQLKDVAEAMGDSARMGVSSFLQAKAVEWGALAAEATAYVFLDIAAGKWGLVSSAATAALEFGGLAALYGAGAALAAPGGDSRGFDRDRFGDSSTTGSGSEPASGTRQLSRSTGVKTENITINNWFVHNGPTYYHEEGLQAMADQLKPIILGWWEQGVFTTS